MSVVLSSNLNIMNRASHAAFDKCFSTRSWLGNGIARSHHNGIQNTFDIGHNTTMIQVQHIPRNRHTVFALLCFAVVIHWLIFPFPSGLLHWHCGNLTIAPVPAKQPWWIWINTSCEFIMNDCLITTKQSTTKPCAYFLGYTVQQRWDPEITTIPYNSPWWASCGISIMNISEKGDHRKYKDCIYGKCQYRST